MPSIKQKLQTRKTWKKTKTENLQGSEIVESKCYLFRNKNQKHETSTNRERHLQEENRIVRSRSMKGKCSDTKEHLAEENDVGVKKT